MSFSQNVSEMLLGQVIKVRTFFPNTVFGAQLASTPATQEMETTVTLNIKRLLHACQCVHVSPRRVDVFLITQHALVCLRTIRLSRVKVSSGSLFF